MAKILCIDDEPVLRMLVAELLTGAGHEVVEATDGKDGLQAILQHPLDLVISDSLMPGMNGGELLTVLRADYPQFNAMPFVFLSANADAQAIEEGLALGASMYLTKPVDFDHLIETVEVVLRSTRTSIE